MSEAHRGLERELRRAEELDRRTRALFAELDEQTAEIDALLSDVGCELAQPLKTPRLPPHRPAVCAASLFRA